MARRITEEYGDEVDDMSEKFQCLVLHKHEKAKRGKFQNLLSFFSFFYFLLKLNITLKIWNLYNFLQFLSGKIYKIFILLDGVEHHNILASFGCFYRKPERWSLICKSLQVHIAVTFTIS